MHGKWWVPLYEFSIHVFVATGIFFVIAAPAVGLNFAIHWLESIGIDGLISITLKGTEYFIFFIDITLFWIFIFSSAIKAGKKIWVQNSSPL